MGHVLCIKFLTHCFQSNGVSSVNTFLMFSGRIKHPAASVFSHLGYGLIQAFNYSCVCLAPHTETHAIPCEHIRGRGNGISTHWRKEGEGELRTWLSSSSTLYIPHQGVLAIAKVPTGVLWITLILCVYQVEETENIFQLGKSCSVSYERTNYKRPQIKSKEVNKQQYCQQVKGQQVGSKGQ